MLAASFLSVFSVLLWGQKLSLPHALWSAAAAAVFAAVTELFTPGEFDTVTIPVASACALLLFASA